LSRTTYKASFFFSVLQHDNSDDKTVDNKSYLSPARLDLQANLDAKNRLLQPKYVVGYPYQTFLLWA
jgi:hypothetical protein